RVPPRRGPSSGALIALTLLGVLAVAALGVGLYLASKPQLSAVPQLVGLTSAQAQIKLEQAKLNGKSTTVAGNCDKDKVISQDPQAGIQLAQGRTVSYNVCGGPDMVLVPQLMNLDQQHAEN